MARKKFLRSKWRTYSKLGRGRKKKQKYRKAKGRHNKMREKLKGNPKRVSIGYKKSIKGKGKEITISIFNIRELERVGKDAKIFIAKIGKKKKIEIARRAKSLGLKLQNLNIDKFLKKIEKEQERKAKRRTAEKSEKDKKGKEKKKEEKVEEKIKKTEKEEEKK